MSDIQIQTPAVKPEEVITNKRIGPVRAYITLLAYILALFIIGILVGKLFFWNNYTKTSLADRQISTLQNKLQSSPKDAKTLTDLGWSYFQKGDHNQALNYYRQAIEVDNKYYPAHLNLGVTYLEAKKYELAIESFKQAITLSPKAPAPHLNLGIAYIQTAKYEEAVRELTLANDYQPGSVETLYQLGFAYEKLQKYKEAADQYNGALQFNPKYSQATDALTRIKDKI